MVNINRALLLWITAVMWLAIVPAAGAFDHTHGTWDRLLNTHVRWINGGVASQADYSGFKKDMDLLDNYLDTLSAVTQTAFDQWSKEQQLAFLINAYNAFTVRLILTAYPDLESIKDLGSLFTSPWEKRFFVLLGKERHLDEIEHGMIRKPGVYDDPRVHAAVNCASIGCPALRNEAYTAERLEAQLDDNMARYLRDRSRNNYRPETNTLVVGKIFKWYEEDFQKGYRGITSLPQFFSRHADLLGDTPAHRAAIRNMSTDIAFSDYDWSLNDWRR